MVGVEFNKFHVVYVELELEVPKNTEWQEQICHKSVPDEFRSKNTQKNNISCSLMIHAGGDCYSCLKFISVSL